MCGAEKRPTARVSFKFARLASDLCACFTACMRICSDGLWVLSLLWLCPVKHPLPPQVKTDREEEKEEEVLTIPADE